MIPIIVYIAFVIGLGLFSMLVMYNYWRYRLTGDFTLKILIAFVIAFAIVTLSGFTFIRSTTPDTSSATDQTGSTKDFQ